MGSEDVHVGRTSDWKRLKPELSWRGGGEKPWTGNSLKVYTFEPLWDSLPLRCGSIVDAKSNFLLPFSKASTAGNKLWHFLPCRQFPLIFFFALTHQLNLHSSSS